MTVDRETDDYEIHSDLARMDLDRVHRWLSTDAFWALGRSRETVDIAAQHSLNFAAFAGDGSQVAYALFKDRFAGRGGCHRTSQPSTATTEISWPHG